MQTELNKEVKVKKEKIESPWTVAFKRLKKNKLALGGLFILLVLVLISIFGKRFFSVFINISVCARASLLFRVPIFIVIVHMII